MIKKQLGYGLLVGALLTAAWTALLFAGNWLLGTPNAAFDLFDFVARVLPGPVITFGIDAMIDTFRALGIDVAANAKTAEQIIAVSQFFGLGSVLLAAFFVVWPRLGGRRWTSLLPGLIFGALLLLAHAVVGRSALPGFLRYSLIAALSLFWGTLGYWAWLRLREPDPVAAVTDAAAPRVHAVNRRQFLVGFGASTAVVTVAGAGVAAALARTERRREEVAFANLLDASGAQTTVSGSGAPLPNLNDPVRPAPGTRLEYTPIPDHYKVFINTEPSNIEEADWVLPVTGLVDNPLLLTLAELRERYPAHDQFNTITCISGRVGTGLISTTLWTGLRLSDLLADARVRPEARYLIMTCADGFYETLNLDLLAQEPRILLAYDWDGLPIPKDHGFPLRIWIPDRYGMKQPKWITGLELSDTYQDGYWVERSWDLQAIVKTTSVIDTVAVNDALSSDGTQLVPVGGIAYAGARGISAVEVRVDGGPWAPALLRTPLSDTTWVVWRYEWPFAAGEHTFEVRCREADGTPQIEESKGNRPDGASGIDSFDI